MATLKSSIEKERIANSFAHAAKTYDANAFLQKKVADQLINNIAIKTQPLRVLDLGSGTGYCSEKLSKIFPDAEIINLDLAEGMLVFARNKIRNNNFSFVCADAEFIPFQDCSFDLIISSLTIQWCKKYSLLFSELYRVLDTNGSVYLSSFGSETLQELKHAWQKVDDYVHVNEFVSASYLNLLMKNSPFARYKIEEINEISYYVSIFELGNELKAIGAHNMNKGQSQGLSGRKKISMLHESFAQGLIPGKGIPVTYAVQYISLRK